MRSRNFHKFPRNGCEWNIHKIAIYKNRESGLRVAHTISKCGSFPTVPVYTQCRKDVRAHPVGYLLPVPPTPLSHAHSLSLSWSLTFASLLLGLLRVYVYATSNEIISLPVLVRKLRGIMLCRGRHVSSCTYEIESALKDQTEQQLN